ARAAAPAVLGDQVAEARHPGLAARRVEVLRQQRGQRQRKRTCGVGRLPEALGQDPGALEDLRVDLAPGCAARLEHARVAERREQQAEVRQDHDGIVECAAWASATTSRTTPRATRLTGPPIRPSW